MDKRTYNFKSFIELEDGRRAKMNRPFTIHTMRHDREAVFLQDNGELLIGYFDRLQEGPRGCEVSVLEDNDPLKAHRIPYAELKGWGYLE